MTPESIDLWLAVHVVGAVMAVGAVTVTDGFFVVFHFHPRFGDVLSSVAPVLSMIVWTGVVLLAGSGVALVLGKPSAVTDRMFLLKVLLTGVVYVNGAVLSFWITPRFREFTERKVYELPHSFQRRAGLGAGVSVVGWWTILFLAYFVV